MNRQRLIFSTYVGDPDGLKKVVLMAQSIREFAGSLGAASIWIYLRDSTPELDSALAPYIDSLHLTVRKAAIPPDAPRLPYSSKVFVAAQAERDASGNCEILAWLDNDVIFVKEPTAFLLPADICLGYRPVQLVNISSRWSEPVNEFWQRLYRKLAVPDSNLFPMNTTTDLTAIRPQFNAGMLIVRPEHKLLRQWPTDFVALAADSFFVGTCNSDRKIAVFLHQAALAGTILRSLSQKHMLDLPSTYNYAIAFADRLPIDLRVKSLDDLVMFRYESTFSDPVEREKLRDSSKIYQWVLNHWAKD